MLIGNISIFRLVTVLGTAVLFTHCSTRNFFAIMATLAIAHYFIAIIYSWRNLLTVLSRPLSAVSLGGLLASSFWMWTAQVPLIALFWPHHVLNEVYINKKEIFPKKPGLAATSMLLSALAFNAFLYIQVTRFHHWGYFLFPESLSQPCAVVSGVWFAASLCAVHKALGLRKTIDACWLELLTLAILFTVREVNVMQLACYHVTVWAFYPLMNMRSMGQTARYLLISACIYAAVYLASPFSFLPWHFTRQHWLDAFTLLSMIHIMTSFALSRAQPEWIWKFFLPVSKSSSATASKKRKPAPAGASS